MPIPWQLPQPGFQAGWGPTAISRSCRPCCPAGLPAANIKHHRPGPGPLSQHLAITPSRTPSWAEPRHSGEPVSARSRLEPPQHSAARDRCGCKPAAKGLLAMPAAAHLQKLTSLFIHFAYVGRHFWQRPRRHCSGFSCRRTLCKLERPRRQSVLPSARFAMLQGRCFSAAGHAEGEMRPSCL